MKTFIGVLIIATIAVVLILWRLFSKEVLPPENEIEEIVVFYNEAVGGLLPDAHEPKEFKIVDFGEIRKIRTLIGTRKIAKQPLMNSDEMDVGPNWVINIFLKSGSFRYIAVDKKQVSGVPAPSSELYQHLRKNYT